MCICFQQKFTEHLLCITRLLPIHNPPQITEYGQSATLPIHNPPQIRVWTVSYFTNRKCLTCSLNMGKTVFGTCFLHTTIKRTKQKQLLFLRKKND